MTSDRHIEQSFIDWQGITLSVTYEADWLSMGAHGHYQTAHLEIRSITPTKAALPITETGYLSHFLNPEAMADHGSPAAYVLAWLDHAAKASAWRNRRAPEPEQFSLF